MSEFDRLKAQKDAIVKRQSDQLLRDCRWAMEELQAFIIRAVNGGYTPSDLPEYRRAQKWLDEHPYPSPASGEKE
jgi:hypothetical protein